MAADRLEARIDPAVKAAATEVAQSQDRSLSNFVEVALKRAIDLHDGVMGERASKRPWRRTVTPRA
jgi:hypothetical protein